MRTQTPISVRMNKYNLVMIDQECYVSGQKRNNLINIAVEKLLTMRDLNRSLGCLSNEKVKKDMLNKWLRNNIPNAAEW